MTGSGSAQLFPKITVLVWTKKALADDANKGKSDIDIYKTLINDEKGVKPGLFEAQVSGGMSGMGDNPSGDAAWLQKKYAGNPFFEG